MKRFAWIMALAWLALAAPPLRGAEPVCDGPLCLEVVEEAGRTGLEMRNRDPVAPVSVLLTLMPDGAGAETRHAVLQPGEIRRMAEPWTPGTGYRFAWLRGDAEARHHPQALYALPIRGSAVSVLQSCDGWFSHRGAASQAVDFALPEGTPVLAARAGRVLHLRMDSRVGGRSKRYRGADNRILVQHADGTVALYGHLLAHSARVEVGGEVAVGEVLALSGNTGFSAAPHLHFEVYTPQRDGTRRTWPVTWDLGTRRVVCPDRGTLVAQ